MAAATYESTTPESVAELRARAAALRARAEDRQAHSQHHLDQLERREGCKFVPVRALPQSRSGRECDWYQMPRRLLRALRPAASRTQSMIAEADELDRQARRIERKLGVVRDDAEALAAD